MTVGYAMRSLRDLPIKRKLIIITMLISGVALLLASLAFAGYERATFRSALVEQLTTSAKIVGENSSAALSFNDPASAEQTLGSLRADDEVTAAVVYDKSGRVFAIYKGPGIAGAFSPPPPEPGGYRFGDDRLEVFQPIVLAGETAGTVYMQASLTELSNSMRSIAEIALAVSLAAMLAAFLLSTTLQRVISVPIAQLSEVAASIASGRDYSIRAVKRGEDELGRLIDGFNHMLSQIQQRDAELQRAQEQLERRVHERTRELQQEIAERKKSEAALQDSEERFSSAFEYAAIGIALVAPDGRWLKVNRALCAMIGYTESELLSNTFQDITHPDDLVADLEFVRQILAGEIRTYQMEKRYFHKDGHTVSILLSVSLVRDAEGQPLHFISQIQDISDRKQAEMELAQTHDQLLDASRLRGMAEVATNVLHNVGNVLNSVNVSATLVSENIQSSEISGLAQAVALMHEHQADLAAFLSEDARGRQLPAYLEQLSEYLHSNQKASIAELKLLQKNVDHIKEIVAMQQTYAGASALIDAVDIRDLVEESLRLKAGKDIEVVRELGDVPLVHIDKRKVLQILVNLVGNARDACDESGRADKRLTLRVAGTDNRFTVAVADNGVGIPVENLKMIFNHGFTTKKAGHGFGLHSAALAAREMGGSLRVESDGIGRGATFTLELPLADPRAGVT